MIWTRRTSARDTSSSIGSGIGSVIPEAMYNAIYRDGDLAFYTYQGLIATASIANFATSSDLTLRKREAAAFLANVWQETQGLVYKEEVEKSNDYCCPAGETRNGVVCPTYGCPAPIPAGTQGPALTSAAAPSS